MSGIDIYLHWPGQTQEERALQYTGFSTIAGKVGYLHEDYHGGPYVTHLLVLEAFQDDREHTCHDELRPVTLSVSDDLLVPDRGCEACKGVAIPADILEERLPDAVEAAINRERNIYGRPLVTTDDPAVQAFRDFVALARRKEDETGEPCTIYANY